MTSQEGWVNFWVMWVNEDLHVPCRGVIWGLHDLSGRMGNWVLGPLDPWQAGPVGVGLGDWGCFGRGSSEEE